MAVYGDRSEYDANQGDVFRDVPFNGFLSDGIITSHDCVLDKYLDGKPPLAPAEAELFVVSVAPVHALDLLSDGRRSAARAGDMPRYFYLPEEDGRPELVADLYLEQPIRFAELLDCTRVTSLSPEWLARLWQQFLRLRLGKKYLEFLRELVERSDEA